MRSAASIIRTYAKAAVALLQEKIALREDGAAMTGVSGAGSTGGVMMLSRSWFNEANTSTWYLVPGLSIVVLTLSASFLGSIVIAREWERGTMETLAITPATSLEIVLSKFLANYALIAVGRPPHLPHGRLHFERSGARKPLSSRAHDALLYRLGRKLRTFPLPF
ncbi:MAG: ABC transporter permease [Sutterella seckii]